MTKPANQRRPKTVIRLPTWDLMVSLADRLAWVPGEAGITVASPELFQVDFAEFPNNPQERGEFLAAVQQWLDEVALESLTVELPEGQETLSRS
jgi:hypothetical protein